MVQKVTLTHGDTFKVGGVCYEVLDTSDGTIFVPFILRVDSYEAEFPPVVGEEVHFYSVPNGDQNATAGYVSEVGMMYVQVSIIVNDRTTILFFANGRCWDNYRTHKRFPWGYKPV